MKFLLFNNQRQGLSSPGLFTCERQDALFDD